ncbi:MAG: TIGR02206 family membrane protein [Clostridia bacterium]|nr:TIGR02206 family membrane protein [Clostridia bacterium]
MFFVTKDSMPEGYGFSTFDLTHITWLLVGSLLCIGACIFYKKLTPQKQKIMLSVLGVYIFFQEMLKNLIVALVGEFSVGYLPFHLCGISILLILFDVIKQTKVVRTFLYYIGIPGAALAILFPNWTTQPVWNFFHLHSFLIHILIVMYPLILVTSGSVETGLKSAFKSVLLLIALAIPVYFLNLLWDTNFMFLMRPDSGNPLELFEQIFGNHLWGFPILLPVVILIMHIPVCIVKKVRK